MPIISKYSNQEVEQIIAELLATLKKNNASAELSLMCLGNAASIIIKDNFPKQTREQIAESFSAALKDAAK
ncbi:YejL family protein [Flocculibacter collagenilyticus]|uniref:DUF1414 domain-containing protein n=1 Tax=Flocculibacter collagenilyticus TaxID=2744479 RepID=UPI0018F6EF3F|nr:DUF1414 domain-containing protein [Flocculibacter collagenilyticus]